jgi:hypothetical protein
MKRIFLYSVAAAAMVAAAGITAAEHNKDCKGVHGKATAVTEQGVVVNDKLFKVGETTRVTKGDQVVKLQKVTPGDIVCLDTRGRDDLQASGEVASLTVLSPDANVTREKEVVREKEKIEIREKN